jgi:hypothetical protein
MLVNIVMNQIFLDLISYLVLADFNYWPVIGGIIFLTLLGAIAWFSYLWCRFCWFVYIISSYYISILSLG